jgi:hypothetical protein
MGFAFVKGMFGGARLLYRQHVCKIHVVIEKVIAQFSSQFPTSITLLHPYTAWDSGMVCVVRAQQD